MGSLTSSNPAARAERLATLERLIAPRHVAIVGASADASRTAGRPLHYLREHGFAGAVYVVNPRYESIDGTPCFPTVAALPETPDVGLVVLGPDRATDAVRELSRRGTPAAIVLSGGFAEIDAAGQARQSALRDAAGAMRLLGPNSIGLVNVARGLTLSPSSSLEMKPLQQGRIGLVSQSGGVLSALLSRATARGVGFSKLVATGNEADLDALDILEYLLDDTDTMVIALYLEGLRDPARFRALAAEAAARNKPIVVHKVGRSEAGARSAVSHTGALAGRDELYDALFAQVGAYRTRTFGELIDVPAALAAGRRLHGPRLGILTSTGGAGVLVADACGVLGLDTPPPDAATAARLAAVLVGDGAVPDRNPVDVTLAGLKSEIFAAASAAILDSPTYDALVVVVGASSLASPDLAAGPIVAAQATSAKPIVAYVSPHAPAILHRLNQQGVPTFDAPEGCAAALGALRQFATPPRVAWHEPRSGAARAGVETLPGGALNEFESKRLLARFGVRTVREHVASTPADAARAASALGERVVLKVLARDLPHKSDVGGVAVGVPVDLVAQRATDMLAEVGRRAPAVQLEGLLVQELVAGGIEMIVGVRRDPLVGAVVLVGAGGVLAEALRDTAISLAPLDLDDARAMIARLRSAVLLRGFRGRPAADIDALARTLVALSELSEILGPRLEEAEINPLIVLPDGQGALAADALVVLGAPTQPEKG